MKFNRLLFRFSIIILMITGIAVQAQTPFGWRGPDRNGIYYETGLLKEWPANGPELQWEVLDVGKGYSSPVVVNNKLFITGFNKAGDREVLAAYSLDGKKLFETEYGSPWDQTYPETRTTPSIEGNKAYVISGSGEVVCINTQTGEIIWKVDGGTRFERKTGIWGTSESPLVFDNKVIYTPGGVKTTMVALNAETGNLVWQSESIGDASSYVSPILIENHGNRKIVGVTGKNVVIVNPETGKIEFTFSDWGPTNSDWEKIAPNSPIYHDGMLFFSFGYDIGSFMLQLNMEATNARLVWRNMDFDTHHGGFVLLNGVIYGPNWINNGQGNWIAVDWYTGATLYENAWSGKSKGSIIAADGMLYCYEERRGTVALVRPNREKFDVVSEFRVTKGDGPYWAHPVISNGILYVRHGNALMAYRIK